ncbi:zinc (Zn2+)-iron permease family metal cation transporter [Roseivivax marinus]|uniref:Zinc (Zn2+)-iron permease family metal cation transporter n=1 Tax=Roseivivax marinus TaxID=1379903 RepID=W4HPW1_9RHOB|nr:ZIP family metal transporter [Roseivivax marinus]ETW14030.1 zinc (Zn2+)-iron permease family metal cation transporter [Roseivivax marinus]UMA63699.1 ZIP family metal transporter [Roseivivax marinus]SEK93606.1 zinc transporter, ZIP family [Roseivivax marinus]
MENVVLLGVLASLVAGTLTGVGALPVLFGRSVSQRSTDTALGFAAGVMISASFFSLILPGLDRAETLYGSVWAAATIAALGLAGGAAAVWALNTFVPHEHFVSGPDGADPGAIPKIWLFVIAITIHNLPEGMAVGVGFGGGDMANGMALATGIGLQNAPEGLAVAAALRGQGYGKGRSVGVALLTGLVEPVGGLVGAAAATVSAYVLPFALTFAAGAMLFIISHEIIPETHRNGHENKATLGLLIGLILMMFLDVTLG